jgi:D-alanine-D-alanine ligase
VRVKGLPAKTVRAIKEVALRGYQAMGLRDYVRFDLRVTAAGVPYVIDVNPNCDLSREMGGFSRATYAAGLTYEDLVCRIVEQAIKRSEQNKPAITGAAR